MRNVYEIQKDIARVRWMLDNLILEKTLTQNYLANQESIAIRLTNQTIEKMMNE